MCPSCGFKDFDATPPAPQASLPTQTPAASNHSASQSNAAQQSSHFFSSGQATTPIVTGSLGARLIAYFIDLLILTVISAVPVTLAYLLTLPNRSQGTSLFMAAAVLAAYVLPFVYFTVMPASTHQATFGKKAMGLKLVTVQGERLTKAQAFIRVLLTMIIPIAGIIAVSLSFGGMAINYKEEFAASVGLALLIAIPAILIGPYLTVFFNPLKQTLFDLIVKTVVVKG
jgi:uncharacterized RDD family membrane protein YckC